MRFWPSRRSAVAIEKLIEANADSKTQLKRAASAVEEAATLKQKAAERLVQALECAAGATDDALGNLTGGHLGEPHRR